MCDDKKPLGVPIPRCGPEPVTFNPADIGFTIGPMSDDCQQRLDEIERNIRNARMHARLYFFD